MKTPQTTQITINEHQNQPLQLQTTSCPQTHHACVEIDHEIISTAILIPSGEPFKGQHWGSPWQLLGPISYNCYTHTFQLIPSDDDKIRPTFTQSCVWNDQIHWLISYPKKFKWSSCWWILCFLFIWQASDWQLPYFNFEKKNVKDWKNITSRFELYPPDFNRDGKLFKAY